jgi:hypothetical protein
MAQVRTAQGRVVFEGDTEAAAVFVESKFPHIANNVSGGPDDGPVGQVVMVDDDGAQHAFVGGKWEDVNYDLGQRGDAFVKQEKPAQRRASRNTDDKKE